MRHKTVMTFVLCLAGVSCVKALVSSPADAAAVGATVVARVDRVVDGDTLYLKGQPMRFRLWGIDTPEKSDPGYNEARNALAELASGRNLQCVVRDIDDYGRPVASCTLPDGRDLGTALVSGGWACDFSRFSLRAYRGAQEAARKARSGVWAGALLPALWPKRCSL